MERVQILINKLKQQHEENADPLQMMMTVQLLQNELMQILSTSRSNLGTSKVAVTLPKTIPIPIAEEVVEVSKPIATMPEKEIYAPRNGTASNGTPKKSESANLLFDPLVEIPTLSHQQQAKEINDAATHDAESYNDRLKQEKTELVDRLKHEPIKDLRKAIGINDRFVFINELFRGDEAMYERSIKTLNSFYNFAEAEYWINRELTLRLGWDQYSELVKHFYQLVKRRFS